MIIGFLNCLSRMNAEGKTFVIQYFANEKNDYDEYINHHAPALREKAFAKWGNQFIAFRTLLKSCIIIMQIYFFTPICIKQFLLKPFTVKGFRQIF